MRAEIINRMFEEINSCGLTYTEIAKKVGISVVMLSQYKNLSKLPSLETFTKICSVINASADYILGLKEY
ncbi:MAG TPA: XRE family transcriptional regulator [Clostridiales bacterium]|nr:helix-turn-helix transcriptional regulator [Eubacteriales bacterium]HBO49144.1 XRE family transcriptional regulator [Clostridiales bacterium]